MPAEPADLAAIIPCAYPALRAAAEELGERGGLVMARRPPAAQPSLACRRPGDPRPAAPRHRR